MLSGYAEQANGFPDMHHREHPTLAGTLYWVGFCAGMAKSTWRHVWSTSPLKKIHNLFAEKKFDTDDPEHIGWVYRVAAARAAEFKIEGVTWSLAQGVVKNIIPAIASTNAVIAGKS